MSSVRTLALRDTLRSSDSISRTVAGIPTPRPSLFPEQHGRRSVRMSARYTDLDPTGATRLSDRAQALKTLLPRVDRVLDRRDGIRIE